MSAPNGNNPPFYPRSAFSYLYSVQQQIPQQTAPQGPQPAPGQPNAAPAQPRMLQPQPAGFWNLLNVPAPLPAGVEEDGVPELRIDRKRDREEDDVNERGKRARVEQGGTDLPIVVARAVPVPQALPPERDPDAAFINAIGAGDVEAFMALWQPGTVQASADAFLHRAVHDGQARIAEFLLQQGADPDAKTDDTGDPPIVVAALKNDRAMVELLLRHGAAIDAWHIDGSEMGALAASARHPDLELFRFLLANRANIGAVPWLRRTDDDGREEIDDQGSGYPYTPLMQAARHGNIEAVRLLLEKGVDLTEQDRDSRDAFRHAAKAGQLAICQLLVESGANVDAEDLHDGTGVGTSLTCAAEGGNLAILQMVVDARSEAQAKLAKPKELIMAISCGVKGGHVDVVLALCSLPFELNLEKQPYGMATARDWMKIAVKADNIAMMAALQDVLQSQFPGWTLDGYSLCSQAIELGKQQALAWLVRNFNLDINAPYSVPGLDGDKLTLLMHATTMGNLPMMGMLLQMGAKIVVDQPIGPGVQRYSALDAAQQSGQHAALRLLQDRLTARGNG